MSLIEKLYSFIILLSVAVGLALGSLDPVADHAEIVIVPLLISMLYITFLQIPLEELKKSFGNVRFTVSTVIINFVWTPLFAWLLAGLFLADYPALWIGFIMLMVTPCTDWYLIFTNIAKGNVALSTSILPLNLLLQVLLLPFYLLIFGGGAKGSIELSYLIESVAIVLLLPLLLALVTKAVLNNKRAKDKIYAHIGILPVICLSLAIAAMFASQGQLLLNHLDLLWKLFIPVVLFFVVNFIIARKAGSLCRFSYEDKVSFHLTVLARNSPIALAIAMTAFPDQPLIALTLVIGPLLELPILALTAQLLLLGRQKG